MRDWRQLLQQHAVDLAFLILVLAIAAFWYVQYAR